MMRRAVLAVLIGLAWMALSFTPAQAASYVDETVQALQSGNVYVSVQVGITGAVKDQLVAATSGSDIAVVALPASAVQETGGDASEFLAEVSRQTGYDTIVIAFGDDLVAGSRILAGGEANALANQSELGQGSVAESLLDFVAEVKVADAAATNELVESMESGALLWTAVIFVVLGFVGWGLAHRYMKWRKSRIPTTALAVEAPEVDPEVERAITAIEADVLRLKAISGRTVQDNQIIENISAGLQDTRQLFVRMHRLNYRDMSTVAGERSAKLVSLGTVVREYATALEDSKYSKVDDYRSQTATAVASFSAESKRLVQLVTASKMAEFEIAVRVLGEGKSIE